VNRVTITVVMKDSAVHLVSTLGGVVILARAELGSIITSALPVGTVLTRERGWGRTAAVFS
jgi:hypothetical protein